MADEVAEKVISTLASVKRIPADTIKLDTSLQDLGIDSLGFVELREQVEKRFSIVISDDDFTPENFSTISSLTSLINRYCSANTVRP